MQHKAGLVILSRTLYRRWTWKLSWCGDGSAHLVLKGWGVFLLVVCCWLAGCFPSPLWFDELGEWKPCFTLAFVEFGHGRNDKQPFCPIPFAAHHFLFCLCFSRHLAAFTSGLSVQHPVLALHQDVSHSDNVVRAFCPEVLGGCRCFSWAAARRLWMFMSLGTPHQMLFYTEWAWLWLAGWLDQ